MLTALRKLFEPKSVEPMDRDEALTGIEAHDADVEKGLSPLNANIATAEKRFDNCKRELQDAESALRAAKYAKSQFVTAADRRRAELERAIQAGADPIIDEAIRFIQTEIEGLGQTLDWREGRVYMGTTEKWREDVFAWMPVCANGAEVDRKSGAMREAIRKLEELKLREVHDVRAEIERIGSEI